MDYLNWKNDISQNSALPHIDWDALIQYSIGIKCGRSENTTPSMKCTIPPIYSMGGVHLVRLLVFEDGTKWIARIQLQKGDPRTKALLLSEKHTLSIIRERTAIPVPKVLGYEDCQDRIGRAFMIMEFVPGSTAMDAFGGSQVHGGAVPQEYRAKFHEDIAKIQTNMTSIRFPQIGIISQRENGNYVIDAIPGLGGPFGTAKDFLLAWADNAKFPMAEASIRSQLSQLPLDMAEEIITSIHNFPALFKKAVSRMSFHEGPFPLHHPDFNHSNIVIDDAHRILSVIDWDGASTVPWEIVEFPMFLYTVPPPIDVPSKYDPAGNPISPEIQRRWEERLEYVESVKRIEEREHTDCMLSNTLACRDTQNLATSLRLYADVGKVGYYCRLLE